MVRSTGGMAFPARTAPHPGTAVERAVSNKWVELLGQRRAITIGRVNGHIFLEACAIGLFGETIALGDSAKDMELLPR